MVGHFELSQIGRAALAFPSGQSASWGNQNISMNKPQGLSRSEIAQRLAVELRAVPTRKRLIAEAASETEDSDDDGSPDGTDNSSNDAIDPGTISGEGSSQS